METKNTETQETQKPANKGQKQNKTIWIIGIVLGLIALFVLIVALIPTEEKTTFWGGIKHGFHLLLIMKVLGIKAWILIILAEIAVLITGIIRFAKADDAGAKVFDFLWRQHGHLISWATHHLDHAVVAIVKSDVWKKIGKGEFGTREIWTIAGIVSGIILIINFGTFGLTLIQIGEWKLRWAGLSGHYIFSEGFPIYLPVIFLGIFILWISRSLKTYKRDVVPGYFFLDKYLGVLDEGLNFVPYGLAEVIIATRKERKVTYIIKVLTGEKDKSKHALDKPFNVEVVVIIRMKTIEFEPFFRNAHTEENAEIQIGVEIIKIVGEILRNNTLRWVQDNPEKVNRMIKEQAEMACREKIPVDAHGYNDILKEYSKFSFVKKYVEKEGGNPRKNDQDDFIYLAHTVDDSMSAIKSDKEEADELEEKIRGMSDGDEKKGLEKELVGSRKEIEMKERLKELRQEHSLGQDIVNATIDVINIPDNVANSLADQVEAIYKKEVVQREGEAIAYNQDLLIAVEAKRNEELAKVIKTPEGKMIFFGEKAENALKNNTKYALGVNEAFKEIIDAVKNLSEDKAGS